ncbi:MAG: hypothetical protein ACRD5B_14530 [Nitrososphaeraceae archaeon]
MLVLKTICHRAIYACFFVKNANEEDQVDDVEFYISTGLLIPSGVPVSVAREPTKNTSAVTIANKFTAPAGRTFSSPVDESNSLELGTLLPSYYFGLWARISGNKGRPDTLDVISLFILHSTNRGLSA